MVNNDALSLLTSLFSHSHVQLTVPESGVDQSHRTSDSRRDVAFYDEVLTAQLSLHIPSSSALPPPQRGHATYALPISIDESEDDPLEERTEQARATRLALLVFLTCLNIDLRGSYVSPRAPLPPDANIVPPTTAATPSTASNVPHYQRPIPSVDPRDAAYSEPSLPGDEAFFYSTTWQGNKVPSQPPKRNTASERIRARQELQVQRHQSQGELQTSTSYITWDQGEERWLVSWSLEVPVIYTRHRNARPALLLTSSLAMRLSGTSSLISALSASLSGGSPFLALLHPEVSPSWSDHDLLTSLSAGPVYPDESPSQRAARTASALAKLPLSRLPSKVLGSRLVTPERSSRDVGRKIASHIAPPSMTDDDQDADDDQEGDVTDTSSTRRSAAASTSSSSSSSSSSRPSSVSSNFSRNRDLSEKGLVLHGESHQATSAADLNKGESVVTLHRSARCALDVRSAVGAKMRTTTVENVNLAKLRRRHEQAGEGYTVDGEQIHGDEQLYKVDDDEGDNVGRALILCVELENPPESGLIFDVKTCQLDITVPNSSGPNASSQGAVSRHDAKATLMESPSSTSASDCFRLEQGEQKNLLYFVHFESTPEQATLWPYKDTDGPVKEDAYRNVAIVVHGKPLLLAGTESDPRVVTPEFFSTWNCTLDMQSLDKDLRKKTAANLPMPEVLEGAATAASSVGISKNAQGSASSIGGSLKHSASALRAAAEEDARRWEYQQQQQYQHMQQQQQQQQQQGGPVRPGMPGRINTGGLASSPLASRNSTASLQTPEDPRRGLSPSLSSQGGNASEWLATSAPYSPRMAPSDSGNVRIPSLGAGLLAQARLRAASAQQQQQQRIASDVTTSSDYENVTPRPQALSGGSFASPARVASRRFYSLTASSRTASAAVPDGDPNMTSSSVDQEILPLAFDRLLSASTPVDFLGGVLINVRVHGDVSSQQLGDRSAHTAATVRQLGTFNVELFFSNRSDHIKNYLLSWCVRGTSENDGSEKRDSGMRPRPRDRTTSLTSISSQPSSSRMKLMDAQAVYKSHMDALTRTNLETSVIPLEQNVATGPIYPGQSVRVHLPLQALKVGVHALSDLSILDEDTGSERYLSFNGGVSASASRGSGGTRAAVMSAAAAARCSIVVVP